MKILNNKHLSLFLIKPKEDWEKGYILIDVYMALLILGFAATVIALSVSSAVVSVNKSTDRIDRYIEAQNKLLSERKFLFEKE